MSPITRSRTARSYHTNPLTTLEEDLNNLDVSDNEGETAPQTPAPDHNAEVERPEAELEGRRVASSIHRFQIELVLAADPNKGRCLITNVSNPATVQLCHLVAQATKTPTVRVSGLLCTSHV